MMTPCRGRRRHVYYLRVHDLRPPIPARLSGLNFEVPWPTARLQLRRRFSADILPPRFMVTS